MYTHTFSYPRYVRVKHYRKGSQVRKQHSRLWHVGVFTPRTAPIQSRLNGGEKEGHYSFISEIRSVSVWCFAVKQKLIMESINPNLLFGAAQKKHRRKKIQIKSTVWCYAQWGPMPQLRQTPRSVGLFFKWVNLSVRQCRGGHLPLQQRAGGYDFDMTQLQSEKLFFDKNQIQSLGSKPISNIRHVCLK